MAPRTLIHRPVRGRCARTAIAISLSLLIAPALAAAQPEPAEPTQPEINPQPAPDPASSITRLLAAPYLTDQERSQVRLFHGIWKESDLSSPALAAQAALARGDYLDPSFEFEGVDPFVRIQALIARGDFSAAQAALDALPKQDVAPILEFRLRAEVLEARGEFDRAAETCIRGLAALATLKPAAPADVVDGVRLLAQRIRLKGIGNDNQAEPAGRLRADPQAYHEMIQALGQVRDNLDAGASATGSPKLFWPSLLAEAELLYSRDNAQKAQEAITELLALNPTCTHGWALLGRMSVDAFNFDATERIAQRLDLIAGNPAPGAELAEGDPEPAPVPNASIDAAMIRARAAMRQIDGARAADVLDPLLAKYPNHPGLLALRAAAEATRFEFERVAERLADYDRRFPNSPRALYEVGKALAESRQYEESAKMLFAAHERMPAAPEILAELGLMYVQFGMISESLDTLEKAYALDPFNIRVDNTLRLVRELLTYAEVESPHFIVRYKPGSPGDAVFARDIITGMEHNHAIVTGNGPGGLDHQPFGGKGKTIIDLMPDHEWFGVRIAGMPAIHTIAASTGPLIAMEAPREGANHQGNYDWLRVLRHEYTHTVNLDRTRNRIPHWFTEANAVYLELSPREFSTCQLLLNAYESDGLFTLDEINIAFVRPRRASDRSQGYAQGHWMNEYIIERWGNKAPLDLMDLYAQGVREEQAFQAVLGLSRAAFLADFKVWAREQLVVWGMLPGPGQPMVKDLLREAVAAMQEAPTKDGESPAHPTAEEANGDDPGPTVTDAMIADWLERYPTHPDVLELSVTRALKRSGGKAAPDMVELLTRYAAARPVDPKPHRLLAQMYLADASSPDRFKAIEHLEYLDAREQKLTVYATELAKLYFARAGEGDLTLAQGKAERATQIAPYEAPPRELAAAIAIKAGDLATARRHIEALVDLEPTRDIHRKRLEALAKLESGAR